jgi:hypothetical protein
LDSKTVRNIMLMLSMCLVASACEDRFRYPCQDPKNWEVTQCKPPICTATGTCPEDVTQPEKVKQ